MTSAADTNVTKMTLETELSDWRLLERIIGLTSRLGCSCDRVFLDGRGNRYTVSINFIGETGALRRLRGQLTRFLNDDKEMSQ